MAPPIPSPQRVALVLPSVLASGTERRISFVFRHLERRYPGQYLLIVSPDLFPILNRGGFGLDRLPGVRVLGPRSPFDRKAGAHAPWFVNLGRLATLRRYREELRQIVEVDRVSLLQAYLEVVPVLGLFPIRDLPTIVSVVDHIPKYFDGATLDSRLLLRASRQASAVDCLFGWVAQRLEALGVPSSSLNYPEWNTVNHDAFHPESKDLSVSFAARAIDWKNPLLMIEVIDRVLSRRPDVRFSLLGRGSQQGQLVRRMRRQKWTESVLTGYFEDPSPIVNRSLIHVSLDQYDNFTNQSLLEGMSAGCAVVASNVGNTDRVVDEEVGLLVELNPESVAEAILQLADDPARVEAMGKAGRQRVLSRHHVDRYVDYLRALHDPNRAAPLRGGTQAPEVQVV